MSKLCDADQLPFLDMDSERYKRQPFEVLSELFPAPLARSLRGVEVLSYEGIAGLQNDQRVESLDISQHPARAGGPLTREYLRVGRLVNLDRARHDRIRRVLMTGFTPARIEALRKEMRRIADRLIDGITISAPWDFVAEFSHQYSIEVLTTLIGVSPEAIPKFEDANMKIGLMNRYPIDPHLDTIEQALETLLLFCQATIDERAVMPGEDFISHLVEIQRSGERLSEAELLWNVVNFLPAGHDTTRYQLAGCLQALLLSGQWQDVVRDPSLVENAVSEGMRFYPTGLATSRVVVDEGVFVDGFEFPLGTHVFFNMLAASRDGLAFDNPEEFSLSRPEYRAIFFGNGVHKCIGYSLARAEMEEALATLVCRVGDLRPAKDLKMAEANQPLWGPDRLWVIQVS